MEIYSDTSFLFVDLESDSLRANRLLQIAAIDNRDKTFSIHINPFQDLSPECTHITGLSYDKNQRELFKNGQKIYSQRLRTALIFFRNWVNKHPRPIILIAHNGFSFDVRILVKYFNKQQIELPDVAFVCDTVPTFRRIRSQIRLNDCTLVTLSEFFNCPMINHHDALCDSETLKKVCEAAASLLQLSMEDFLKGYRKPLGYFLEK